MSPPSQPVTSMLISKRNPNTIMVCRKDQPSRDQYGDIYREFFFSSSVQLPISLTATWMILLVSRNSRRKIMLGFMSTAVWGPLLCHSSNGLSLLERCVPLRMIFFTRVLLRLGYPGWIYDARFRLQGRWRFVVSGLVLSYFA